MTVQIMRFRRARRLADVDFVSRPWTHQVVSSF